MFLPWQTANPEKRVLVLGLDGAGKSSLLKCLSHQEGDGKLEPTEGFNVMCIQAKNTTLNVWEGTLKSLKLIIDFLVSYNSTVG